MDNKSKDIHTWLKSGPVERIGIFFCFVGPGASGKSTICKQLLADDKTLFLSVSTTTRNPRPGEVDGKEFHFVSDEEFENRVANGDFLEHAEFHGRRYGTENLNILASQAAGADLLLDIDLQGARAIKSRFPDKTTVIFVYPPSGQALVDRLKGRGGDSPERMSERVEIARSEVKVLSNPELSDYLLINDQLAESVELAKAIITAERMSLKRVNSISIQKLLEIPNY